LRTIPSATRIGVDNMYFAIYIGQSSTLRPQGYNIRNKSVFVALEVLTAAVMKITIFWDIPPCSSLKVNRCFGGTYRLYLQGGGISRTRNNVEIKWQAELSTDYTALYPRINSCLEVCVCQ
jgi:hypothetical protein